LVRNTRLLDGTCMANGVHEGLQARCMALTREGGWAVDKS